MNHYGNDEQRVRLIAGLRDLAVFLDQNPDVPAPSRADLLIFPPEASDAEMFAEIDTIAELIGSTASDADSPRGHYSAVRDFGPVQYLFLLNPLVFMSEAMRLAVTPDVAHMPSGLLLAGLTGFVALLTWSGARAFERRTIA